MLGRSIGLDKNVAKGSLQFGQLTGTHRCSAVEHCLQGIQTFARRYIHIQQAVQQGRHCESHGDLLSRNVVTPGVQVRQVHGDGASALEQGRSDHHAAAMGDRGQV